MYVPCPNSPPWPDFFLLSYSRCSTTPRTSRREHWEHRGGLSARGGEASDTARGGTVKSRCAWVVAAADMAQGVASYTSGKSPYSFALCTCQTSGWSDAGTAQAKITHIPNVECKTLQKSVHRAARGQPLHPPKASPPCSSSPWHKCHKSCLWLPQVRQQGAAEACL